MNIDCRLNPRRGLHCHSTIRFQQSKIRRPVLQFMGDGPDFPQERAAPQPMSRKPAASKPASATYSLLERSNPRVEAEPQPTTPPVATQTVHTTWTRNPTATHISRPRAT